MNIISGADAPLPQETKEFLKRAGDLAAEAGVGLYLAGGIVRDLVMKRPNLDIDLVVDGDGAAFAKTLAEREGGSVVLHDRFGTSVVIMPGKKRVDVATARTEVYEQGGALPKVEFAPIEADLSRRDFSINAMAVSLNKDNYGELLDYFDGRGDIRGKRVRVLHDDSFVDDPTRIFRAVRFERRFGFKMTTETERLLAAAVSQDLLKTVSGARIRNEINAVFAENDPVAAIGRLEDYGVWGALVPGVNAGPDAIKILQETLEAEEELKGLLSPRYKRGYAFLLALLKDAAPESAVSFSCLININRARTKELVETPAWVKQTAARLEGKDLPVSAVYLALEHKSDEALVFLYAHSATAAKTRIREYLSVRKTKPFISGRDLVRMGYRPSAKFADVLRKILLAQLDGQVSDKSAEMDMAGRLMGDA